MPDFFERLVSPVRRTVVRPRLPGPFERVEALHAESPGTTELATPRAVASSPTPADVLREVRREVRTTDRVTLVRTGPARPEAPRPARPQSPMDAPEPVPRPAPTERAPRDRVPNPEHPTPPDPQRIPPESESRPSPGVLRVETAPVPSERPRTRIAAAAARASAPHPRRRSPERSEPTVRVEIGRLEVNAARPQQRTRPESAQRREPTVNLATYLSERANS